MNKVRLKTAFLTLILTLSLYFSVACSEIDYPDDAENTADVPETVSDTGAADESGENDDSDDNEDSEDSENNSPYKENKLLNYSITRKEFSEKTQFESLDGQTVYSALNGFEGEGYIQLDEDMIATINIEVPTSQHYRIGVNLCSVGGIVLLSVNGIEQGAYYIKDADSFSSFYLNYIFLRAGVNRLEFKGLKGISYLDFSTVTDISAPPVENYSVSSRLINENASNRTKDVMMYLSNKFGKSVLTGQHCTVNSNAEINAVYAVAGRYPAIRCGDLSNYSRYYNGSDKALNKEIELSEEWAKKGGLVCLNWSWYSPTNTSSHFFASQTNFNLDSAYTAREIALLDTSQLEAYFDNGIITESCLEIIRDIDNIAENLKKLRDNDVTVLWRPLAEAGIKWYWWGNCNPRSYIWLWKLMVDRMNTFHGLDNLIWVWNGENQDYYPGDDYVDIIGEDVYNKGDTSNASRFAVIYGTKRKAVAMTECGLVPNPDVLFRDNARWLWFSLYRGDYLVDDSGFYRGGINTKERLIHAYNHEKTITLDELDIDYQQ